MTSNVEAMRRLFNVTGTAPNLLNYREIYPKRESPIIRADETGERRVEVASWGIVGPEAAKGPGDEHPQSRVAVPARRAD